MQDKLEQIKKEFIESIHRMTNRAGLEELVTKYVGRKGILTQAMRQVKEIAHEERPRIGKLANDIREEVERMVKTARQKFGDTAEAVVFDATVPGERKNLGHVHPLTIIQYQLEDIFRQMGFMVLDGPEVESEYYNFTALNIPADHPARDTQDTFWLRDGNLLRTHTSPVQVRALQKHGAPFRGIVPGRVFRYEATDASHEHTFHQMEGLMVDRDISIGNLVAVMKALLQNIFNTTVDVRLRPGFFPFVEPGFELDIKCLICHGTGCPVCKRTGWVELIPCGLVHPAVLRAGNVDPEIFSGFAFGLGLSRLVMMKYGIDDIRLLMSGDLRFINQF
ncbi:MAG: phenylalanine--tRNA ligase subunit alpha [Candidatus Komeilibacteria bacterium]|nr:phenylalanine--tRNA ligase subunit alpha [Candidatus Komeilibacteria bacterium]